MMEEHIFFNDKGRYRIKFNHYDKIYRENIEVLEGNQVPEDLTSFCESLKDEETGKYWVAM